MEDQEYKETLEEKINRISIKVKHRIDVNNLPDEELPVQISISGVVLWLTTIIGSILIAIMSVMFAIRCIKEIF